MQSAIATLEAAARRLQLSGELEGPEFSRIMTHLRSVADGLGSVERRKAKREAASVDLAEILHAATAPAAPPSTPIMVEGPARDLRDLLCSLIEYARAVGGDPPALDVKIKTDAAAIGCKCTTELIVASPELPDFLRHKLWEAARVRGGEVSVISESKLCRIEFTIPIDRRLAPAV